MFKYTPTHKHNPRLWAMTVSYTHYIDKTNRSIAENCHGFGLINSLDFCCPCSTAACSLFTSKDSKAPSLGNDTVLTFISHSWRWSASPSIRLLRVHKAPQITWTEKGTAKGQRLNHTMNHTRYYGAIWTEALEMTWVEIELETAVLPIVSCTCGVM